MQEEINFHGVALEFNQKGILITGASGIGKTTSALRVVQEGHYWIADDIAVVKKNRRGGLIVRGHAKIKKLLHTKKTGIVPIKEILGSGRVKNQTNLAGIIEVRKACISGCYSVIEEIDVLGTKLPCLRIKIPSSGYFNKNLLKKTIRQLQKDS